MSYELVEGGVVPIKSWTVGVPFEASARQQLICTAMVPIVGPHIAVMPDVHAGKGSTVGSVIPTRKAIIPAAVGVDIGCGVYGVRTSLTSEKVKRYSQELFDRISDAVPHGGERGKETGNWSSVPDNVVEVYTQLAPELRRLINKHGKISTPRVESQLGTLGGGNHFVGVNVDEEERVWFVIHSGSRGIGNKIGTYFIEKAHKNMECEGIRLPDADLAYLEEGTELFDDYMAGLTWAQEYARVNRELMMEETLKVARDLLGRFKTEVEINVHHNYVARESHFGEDLWVTRKGAIRARAGDMGLVPGCMGGTTYVTVGKGNEDSFCSSSHGAGRAMSRGEAKKLITLEDHRLATEGVICKKDKSVIDESPAAYKDVEDVIKAEEDLVTVAHTLKEIICIKG